MKKILSLHQLLPMMSPNTCFGMSMSFPQNQIKAKFNYPNYSLMLRFASPNCV